MEKICEFNENIVMYLVDKTESLIDKNIKTKIFGEEVFINHYTLDEYNNLKRIFKGEHNVLIREELDKNYDTLIVEVFLTKKGYENGEFKSICNLLSRRMLKMAG